MDLEKGIWAFTWSIHAPDGGGGCMKVGIKITDEMVKGKALTKKVLF